MVSILTAAFAAPTNSRDEKTMKSVSAWYYLRLEKQRQMSAQRSAAVKGGGLLFGSYRRGRASTRIRNIHARQTRKNYQGL